jgi:hypothetical protein
LFSTYFLGPNYYIGDLFLFSLTFLGANLFIGIILGACVERSRDILEWNRRGRSMIRVLRDIQIWKQEGNVPDEDSEGHSNVETGGECP